MSELTESEHCINPSQSKRVSLRGLLKYKPTFPPKHTHPDVNQRHFSDEYGRKGVATSAEELNTVYCTDRDRTTHNMILRIRNSRKPMACTTSVQALGSTQISVRGPSVYSGLATSLVSTLVSASRLKFTLVSLTIRNFVFCVVPVPVCLPSNRSHWLRKKKTSHSVWRTLLAPIFSTPPRPRPPCSVFAARIRPPPWSHRRP